MPEADRTVVQRRPARKKKPRPRADRARPEPTAELCLEVVDGPMDGACLVAGREEVSIGRGPDNRLSLFGDRMVSRRHASLTPAEGAGAWRLADLDSANGTWVAGRRIEAPEELDPGSSPVEVMVGLSVLRLSRSAAEGFLPGEEEIDAEAARLRGRFSPETARGYGAAVALASWEGCRFLTDRHFFLGISLGRRELPIFAEAGGPVTREHLGGALWQNRYWTGPGYWIQGRLDELELDEEPLLFEDDLAVTPRLLRCLQAAEEAGGGRIEARHAVAALLEPASSRPRRLLERAGLDVDAAVALLDEAAEEPDAVPPPAAVAEVSTGEPAIDALAQEIARRLIAVGSGQRLADPRQRRDALRQVLRVGSSGLDADVRRRLLEQLGRLFPLEVAPAPAAAGAAGVAGGAAPAAQAPARAAPAIARPGGGEATSWRLALEADGEALDGLPAEQRHDLRLLREILSFAEFAEKWIASMARNLSVESTTATRTIRLPGQERSLRSLLDGEPAEAAVERLGDYLHAARDWFVAVVTAYHEAPEVWFEEKLWHRINPSRIEASVEVPTWKKSLGVEATEYWRRYRDAVRVINPDLVSDQIRHEVQLRAESHYERLSAGRRRAR